MGLTSWGLLVVLAAFSVGCLALTVWAWPRVSSGGVRAVAARTLILLGCQVAVMLTLVTALNSYYLFYGSWKDLSTAVGGDAQVDQKGLGQNARAAAVTQVVRQVRAGLGPSRNGKHMPRRDGQVEHLDIRGIRTGISSQAFIYLPPQYFQAKFAAHRFPVVLLLAGYPSTDRKIWIKKGRIPQDAARAAVTGELQPMIYVMMRPTVEDGWDTECADVPGGPKVESFFAQDVPEAITTTYRAAYGRQGWGVAGYSTGGYCATKLAMLHSDTFSAGASLAGHFDAIQDTTTRDLYGGSKEVRRASDLIWRLKNLPQPPVSILVASADVGEKTFPQAQKYMAAARPPLVVDKLLLPTGGHNFKTFRRYIPPAMRWLSARLRGE